MTTQWNTEWGDQRTVGTTVETACPKSGRSAEPARSWPSPRSALPWPPAASAWPPPRSGPSRLAVGSFVAHAERSRPRRPGGQARRAGRDARPMEPRASTPPRRRPSRPSTALVKDVVLEPAERRDRVPGTTSADGSSLDRAGPAGIRHRSTSTPSRSSTRRAAKTKKTQSSTPWPRPTRPMPPSTRCNGTTVGAGQPIEIVFSEPVLNKEAMEKAVTVTASSGQAVAWRWYSRPARADPSRGVLGRQQPGHGGPEALRRGFRQQDDRQLRREGVTSKWGRSASPSWMTSPRR